MKSPVHDTPRPQQQQSHCSDTARKISFKTTETNAERSHVSPGVCQSWVHPRSPIPDPLHLWRRQCGRRPGLSGTHRATNGRRRRDLPSPVAVSGTLPCIEDTDDTLRPSLRCGRLGKVEKRLSVADVTPAPGSSGGAEGRRQGKGTPQQAGWQGGREGASV